MTVRANELKIMSTFYKSIALINHAGARYNVRTDTRTKIEA